MNFIVILNLISPPFGRMQAVWSFTVLQGCYSSNSPRWKLLNSESVSAVLGVCTLDMVD